MAIGIVFASEEHRSESHDSANRWVVPDDWRRIDSWKSRTRLFTRDVDSQKRQVQLVTHRDTINQPVVLFTYSWNRFWTKCDGCFIELLLGVLEIGSFCCQKEKKRRHDDNGVAKVVRNVEFTNWSDVNIMTIHFYFYDAFWPPSVVFELRKTCHMARFHS